MNDNIKLWDAVSETDPEYVKQMTHGAKLTAIDATYQKREATALWGPYGDKWGLTELDWSYVEENGAVIGLVLKCFFTYPGGQFAIASDIKFIPGQDCFKKLQSSVLSKALSYLGFNADVFLGRFDDHPYVEPGSEGIQRSKFEGIITAMETAETIERLETFHAAALKRGLNKYYAGRVNETVERRRKELSDEEAQEVF